MDSSDTLRTRTKKIARVVSSIMVAFGVLSLSLAPAIAPQPALAAVTYTETFDTTALKDGSTTADWDTTESVLELPSMAPDFYRLDNMSTGLDNISHTKTSTEAFTRSVAIDSSGNPHVVWSTENPSSGINEVVYVKWNGSDWVDAAGNPFETNICQPTCNYSAQTFVSDLGEFTYEPSLVLDATDTPHIVWDADDSIEFDYDVYYSTWSGSDWVKADGTAGADNIDSDAQESFAPSIALINGEPAVAWRNTDPIDGDADIYFARWSGSDWVDAAGNTSPGAQTDVSGNNTESSQPSLAITSTGTPIIAWRDHDGADFEIYLKSWNGSAWTDIDGGADYNISDTDVGSSSLPTLALYQDDTPAVAWTDSHFGGGNNILFARWNGTIWAGPDGTTAFLSDAAAQVTSDGAASPADKAQMRMRSDDLPVLVMQKGGGLIVQVLYTEWNGSTWTGGTGLDADSNPATFERSTVRYNGGVNGMISLDLNSMDEPTVVFNAGGQAGIFLSHWIEPYQFPGGNFYKTDLSEVGSDGVAVHTTPAFTQGSSLVSDSLGRPHVTWSESQGGVLQIMYARWSGSDWVSAKNTTVLADYIVSNGVAGQSAVENDLVLVNDLPHIAWRQPVSGTNHAFYVYWDPTANAGAGGWVNAAGSIYTTVSTAPAGTIASGGVVIDSVSPSLAVTSAGQPYVSWTATGADARKNVFVSTWGGSDWVKPTDTGTTGSDEVSKDIAPNQDAYFPDIHAAPNSTIGVSWYQDSPAGQYFSWYSQLKTGSPGTWTKADGTDTDANAATYETDKLGAGFAAGTLARFAFNSLSRPSLTWLEYFSLTFQEFDVMFSEWNGSAWVKSDGSAGYDNVSRTPFISGSPQIEIDTNDQPVIVWQDLHVGGSKPMLSRRLSTGTWSSAHQIDIDADTSTYEYSDAAPVTTAGSITAKLTLLNGDTPDVLLVVNTGGAENTVWHEPYAASVTGTSLTMDNLSGNIAKATLAATATLNGGTIVYQMSNDGGATWSTVTSGAEFTFPTTGSDLRWRATLTGNPTNTLVSPQIDTLSISIGDAVAPPDDGDEEPPAGEDPVKRIDAPDPKDLAIKISQTRFGDNEADSVLLTREDLWIDAFVGTSLSTIADGPLLLNPTDSLDSSVLTEIDRVLPSKNNRIYLVGCKKALANKVHDDLAAAGYTNIVRLGGINRDETAELIAGEVLALNATPVDTIMITENVRLVDAMTMGAAAANVEDGSANPILLSDRGEDQLDEFTALFLKNTPQITKAVLVGGHEALPADLEDSIYATRSDLLLSRLFGSDRYGTCRAIVDTYFSGPTTVVVAGGEAQSIAGARSITAQLMNGLIGALLAGTLAAHNGDPLLITKPLELPALISSYLSQNAATITNATIVGTEGDVSSAVAQQIGDIIE